MGQFLWEGRRDYLRRNKRVVLATRKEISFSALVHNDIHLQLQLNKMSEIEIMLGPNQQIYQISLRKVERLPRVCNAANSFLPRFIA